MHYHQSGHAGPSIVNASQTKQEDEALHLNVAPPEKDKRTPRGSAIKVGHVPIWLLSLSARHMHLFVRHLPLLNDHCLPNASQYIAGTSHGTCSYTNICRKTTRQGQHSPDNFAKRFLFVT